jgi:Zinc carboxypeptidase
MNKTKDIFAKVLTDFDGASPCSQVAVKKTETGYLFFPGYRKQKGVDEEQRGGGARFSTRIVNDSDKDIKFEALVDWESESRIRNRDIGFIRHESEEEWIMIPGKCKGSTASYNIILKPGTTHLGLYPAYNYEKYLEFISRMKKDGVKVELMGKSREDRDIHLVRIGKIDRSLPNFLIQARDHAYETAGSYCVEGIADFLLSGNELASYILSKFNVYILPMTNVDGVYNGMSRLTWEKGANLNREFTGADGAWDAIKKTIDRLKPAGYMNIHNFQDKFTDGLYVNEERIAETFQRFMKADTEHCKSWEICTHSDFLRINDVMSCPPEHRSWKNYVKNNFNGIAITFEFPWFMMNSASMREKGKKAFIAHVLTVIEDKKL